MMFRNIISRLMIIVMLLVGATTVWATNGLQPIFVGARGAGRGGADLAVANDATAINTNPAGIAFIRGKMVTWSPSVFYLNLRYSNPYNSGADSDFEPVPAATFGMVWDTLGQSFEVGLDPWRYLFASSPPPHTYQPQGNFEGQGAMNATVARLPASIQVQAWGQGVVLHNIKVYGRVPQQPGPGQFASVLRAQSLTALPLGAVLVSVGVAFQWRSSRDHLLGSQTSNGQGLSEQSANQQELPLPLRVKLTAGQKQVIRSLTGKAGQWHRAYLCLPLEQLYVPEAVEFWALDTGQPLYLRKVELTLGYRLGTSLHYRTLARDPKVRQLKPRRHYVLIASDDQPQRLASGHALLVRQLQLSHPQAEQVDRLRVTYFYRFAQDATSIRYLRLAVRDGDQVLVTNAHRAPRAGVKRPGYALAPLPTRVENYHRCDPTRSSGLKFGFGIFPQGGARFLLETKSELFPEGIENRSDLLSISLAPTLAWHYRDRLAVGVALNVNYQSMEADGLLAQPTTLLQGKTFGGLTFDTLLQEVAGVDELRGEMDSDTLQSFGVGLRVGMMWHITDWLTIGAAFSPEPWMQKMRGKGTVDSTRYFEKIRLTEIVDLGTLLLLPNGGLQGFAGEYDMEVDFKNPAQAGVGLSLLLHPRLMLALDFKWINYRATMKKIKITLKHGDNPDLNVLTAGNTVKTSLRPNWRDQYVIAFGLAWQVSPDWTLRCGYNYGTNPVPRKYLTPQFPGIFEHHVTAGFSYRCDSYLTLSLALMAALPASQRSHDNAFNSDFDNSKIESFMINAAFELDFHF